MLFKRILNTDFTDGRADGRNLDPVFMECFFVSKYLIQRQFTDIDAIDASDFDMGNAVFFQSFDLCI